MTLGLLAAAVLSPAVALAAPKDAEAEDLAKKAIYVDYLATKFADAEKRLKQAISVCEPVGACSPKVKAHVYCDLGIVYVGGMNRADDGKAQFAAALKLDPSVVPDSDLVSPEIDAAFKAAKGGADKPPAPEKPATPPPSSGTGDLVHTPPAEQATLTPVPLYAELPAGTTAARVQLSYKPFGATEWKALQMKPNGKGYEIEVPCVEVGSAQGEMAYFIQAFDGSQNLVSWSGTRAAPNKVAIRTSLQGDAPHLPGQPPPARCPDIGDCPPEFPGCHGHPSEPPPPCDPATPNCVTDDKPAAKKNWISLSIQQDFLIMPGSNAVCAGGNGYDCFDSSNNYYSAIPYPSSGDQVSGGGGVATTRLLAGYDRVLIAGLSVGTRLGVAFRGGPTTPGLRPFLPFHGEARLSYTFGADPFSRTGPRPYVILNGGVAEVDGSVGVKLYQNAADYASNTITTMTAWRKDGIGFIGGGVGLMLAVKPRHGPFLEVKLMELLGASGTSFNLAVGYAFGL